MATETSAAERAGSSLVSILNSFLLVLAGGGGATSAAFLTFASQNGNRASMLAGDIQRFKDYPEIVQDRIASSEYYGEIASSLAAKGFVALAVAGLAGAALFAMNRKRRN